MLIFPAPVFLFSSFVLWQAIHASSFAFSSGSSPEKEEQQQQQTHYSLRHSDINPPSIKSGASYFFGYSNSKANRWTLPYAKAPVGDLRFADPVALDDWAAVLAALGHNSSVLPKACPQPDGSGNEDCLYLNVYAPLGASIGSKLPVFVWVHGGSFIQGSSTAPGLDGSDLVSSENIIVVTVQYRLGLLGFLKSGLDGAGTNMGVKDLVAALSFVQRTIALFGGDATKVTLAGQSSGADLIKTLYTVPSADKLFARSIIHSSPMNYGDQTPSTAGQVGQMALQALNCSDLPCLRTRSVSEIISAQTSVFSNAPTIKPAISSQEPIRPFVDGSFVAQSFYSALMGASLSNKNRPCIFTTVAFETGPFIYSIAPQPLPSAAFVLIVNAIMGSRTTTIVQSGLYNATSGGDDATRLALERLGTDYIFRCATQQSAVNLTTSRQTPSIWLAQFDVGITYPDNANIPFCQGRVCHEDDIYGVFSTGSSLTPEQTALQNEVRSRWSSFIKTGNPNSDDFPTWSPIQAADRLNLLHLNGTASSFSDVQQPAACGPSGLFGNQVLFDEQIYNV